VGNVTVSPAPVALTAVTLKPTSVTGGSSSTGTVTLSSAAPRGGTTIALASSLPAVATVPASISVAAGTSTATFTAATKAVTSTTSVTISASHSGGTKTAVVSVAP
jgi:hypothetical protein